MNSLKTIMMLAMAAFILAGCITGGTGLVLPDEGVDVFGIQMLSYHDYRELQGVEATEET